MWSVDMLLVLVLVQSWVHCIHLMYETTVASRAHLVCGDGCGMQASPLLTLHVTGLLLLGGAFQG